MGNQTILDTLLTRERTALDRWGRGDPGGYLEIYAPDVTYFDPAVAIRVDGLDAMKRYYAPITGKVSIDRYEILNPEVAAGGEMAVLSYNLVNYHRGADGAESVGNRWNVTAVYRRHGETWNVIHSHFSYTERP
jgi:ketosteroid isomerase-like protein